MSRSNAQSDEGLTLLETLVTLSIMATVASVAATSIRTPSDRVELQKIASHLERQISQTRQAAISSNSRASLIIHQHVCVEAITLIFHPNGMTEGEDICLVSGQATLNLHLNNIAGQFVAGAINER